MLPPKYVIIMVPSNNSNFQYRDSDSCRSFSLLKAIAKRLPLLFANAFKSDNYMGSNTEKKSWTNLQNLYKNWSKEIKSDNFCYRKVGRAITKWGAKEKSPILPRNIGIINILKGYPKIISHFNGSNNIFADCI